MEDAIELEQGGKRVLTATLEALLRMKRAANRAKDAQGIARIEEVLRQRREKIVEEGRHQTAAFMAREPLAALAAVSDASTETCLANGARWTLLRVLEQRPAVMTIAVVMRLASIPLSTAKTLVETATEERVIALGDAIDQHDVERATDVLARWLVPEDSDVAERLARSLVDLFSAQ